MLVSVSTKNCLPDLDQYTSAIHFTNNTPAVIEIHENMTIQLIGLAVNPWPKYPFLIVCNLCECQPCGGRSWEDVLSMVSGKDKFTMPKMPMRLGNYYRIDIQLKSYFNEKIAGDVTMQMAIENLL